MDIRVRIFRRRTSFPTRRNYPLDLFDPDKVTLEYSAIVTHLSGGLDSRVGTNESILQTFKKFV